MAFKAQLVEAKLDAKATFFAECRPVVYTQFKVDDAYVGYTTNMCIEESKRGPKLLFRRPNMKHKKAFGTTLFDNIRESFTEPDLLDVARSATNIDRINCKGDFKGFESEYHPNIEDSLGKPWFLLLNQFV
jgi:hypothetical protein